jgi:hypothetical protein
MVANEPRRHLIKLLARSATLRMKFLFTLNCSKS